jgi:peroxiredoxin
MIVGDIAPNFTLSDQTGSSIDLYEVLKSSAVILIFYPYDQSPDCSEQLCAANDHLADFARENVQIFGINNAAAESHRNFAAEKYLDMKLLSDDRYEVARQYGCLFSIGPIRVIRRTVVAIGRDGRIVYYQRGMEDGLRALSVLAGQSGG